MNSDYVTTHLHSEILSPNGQKTPILLLHGWGHQLESLKPLAHLLSPHHPKHLIDLPGFGKSPPPSTIWNSFDYADEIKRYLDSHGLKKIHLLGHSFGGKVSFSFASKYPESVDKLILLGSSGLKRKKTAKEKICFKLIVSSGKLLKKWDRLNGSKYFENYFVPRFGSPDYKSAGVMKPILVRSVNEDLTPIISNIKAKTLLLWGEKDQETPLECGFRFNQYISQSTLISFSQHGHLLFQDAGAHLCAAYINPFIEKEL